MYSFCYVYRHFVCARITDIMDPVNCCYYSMHVHTHYTYIYVAEDSLWQSKRAQHLYPYCIWLFSLGDIYYNLYIIIAHSFQIPSWRLWSIPISLARYVVRSGSLHQFTNTDAYRHGQTWLDECGKFLANVICNKGAMHSTLYIL